MSRRLVPTPDGNIVEPKSYDAAARDAIQQRLQRVDELWGAAIGTPDGDELDKLIDEVEALEAE